METQSDLVQNWLAKLKARPVVAFLIVAALILSGIAGVFKAVQTISTAFRAIKGELARPSVVAFTLSPRANGFQETRKEMLFALSGEKWRTFAPAYPPQEKPTAIFLVTIRNPTHEDLIITRVDYEVEKVGQVMGAPSGPVKPAAKYHYAIRHEVGIQASEMVPTFNVNAGDTASFELEITSATPGVGLGWLLRIGFVADAVELYTDMFQLYLPTPKSDIRDTLEPNTPIPTHDKKADLLSSRSGAAHIIPVPSVRDCAFRMAGVVGNVATLDQLDKDLVYLRASEDTPSAFAARQTTTTIPKSYAALIPADGRTKLQTIIKSHVACEPPESQRPSALKKTDRNGSKVSIPGRPRPTDPQAAISAATQPPPQGGSDAVQIRLVREVLRHGGPSSDEPGRREQGRRARRRQCRLGMS